MGKRKNTPATKAGVTLSTGVIKRIDSQGHARFYLRYRDIGGKRRMRATKATNEAAARRLLSVAIANVERGVMGLPPKPTDADRARKATTVNALADRFLGLVDGDPGYSSPEIKDLASYRQDARSMFKARIRPALGHLAAGAVTSLDVERMRDALTARGLANASVLQTLAVLSKCFSWARRSGHVDCENPVRGVERPTPAESEDYLSYDEAAALLVHVEKAAKEPGATHETRMLWPMAATALFTGMRKGELFGLRWINVHLDADRRARIDVRHSYNLKPKSGEERTVPLKPAAVRVLRLWKEACPTTEQGLVFPIDAEGGRMRMGEREDNAGLTDALVLAQCHAPADGHPWHMLRHTYASHFVMGGGSLYALQRLLGHASSQMSARYAKLAPDFLQAELAHLPDFAPRVPGTVTEIHKGRAKPRRKGRDG